MHITQIQLFDTDSPNINIFHITPLLITTWSNKIMFHCVVTSCITWCTVIIYLLPSERATSSVKLSSCYLAPLQPLNSYT